MKLSNKFLIGLAFLAVLLFYIVPAAFAQAVPPPITPPVSIGDLLVNALMQFSQALNGVTYLPKAVGLVVIGTAILKRFLPPDITIGSTTIGISSGAIALTLQVLAWVIYVVTLQLGYGNQFDTWVNTLTTILTALFGGVVSSVVSTAVYNKSVALGVPVIGYQRPLTPAQMASRTVPLKAFIDPSRLSDSDVDRIARRIVAVLDEDNQIMDLPTPVSPLVPTPAGPPVT